MPTKKTGISSKKQTNRIEEKRADIEEERRKKRDLQIKEHNKALRVIFIVIAGIIFVILAYLLLSSLMNRFTYQGVKFTVAKFCDSGPPCLITYQTSIPVQYQGKTVPYNFYLRNDPRQLNVSFNGTINLQQNMVLNSEEDFTCNGNGGIAGANLVQLYKVIGVNVISDKNATCDQQDRYMYVDVKPGNVTSIEQTGPSCYDITISNCEILQGTEKFMLDTLVKVNQMLKNQSKTNQSASKP